MTENTQAAAQTTQLWPTLGSGISAPVAWVWLAVLTAVAAVLRAIGLNKQLWFDEIATLLDTARAPLGHIVTHYDSQNQHMLYSILAHISIGLLGEQPWTLRLPAVIFAVATIPALYFFGRLVTSNREALLTAALLAVNYQHVWFSQNARAYTAMVFWTLIASMFFIRSARGGKTLDWVGYGVAAALGVYCHLTMAFVVAGHVLVYLWLVAARVRATGRWGKRFLLPLYGIVLSGVVSALLYAPVLTKLFAKNVGQGGHSVRSEWTNPVWAALEALKGLRAGAGGGMVALAIGGLILLAGLIGYWRQNRFLVGLVLFPAVTTAAAVLVQSHNLWPRFFFFEIGFALLFLVRGAMVCGALGARMLGRSENAGLLVGTGLAVLMLLGSLPPLRANYLYPKQDYLGAMSFVEAQERPGEPIVTTGMVATPFDRFYGRNWPEVDTRLQLDGILSTDHATWLVYAMPIAVRATEPDVWDDIQTHFTTVKVFPGTLAGGEIYVCKSNGQETGTPAR